MLDEDPRSAHELQSDEFAPGTPEREEHPGSERRRRPVADWGGDDLFNHVPRRRFSRTGMGTPTRRPSASPITSHQLRRNTDLPVGASARATESGEAAESAATRSASHGALQPSFLTIYEPEPSHSEGALVPDSAPVRSRHRARRSVDQRVGPRPDRIAALAFVLGLLLVLLAVATADAAALTAF